MTLEHTIHVVDDDAAVLRSVQQLLQSFVSAEETQRLTQELALNRAKLQQNMAEWEELGQILQP